MRVCRALCLFVGLFCLIGCASSSSTNAAGDSDAARQTLVAALEAWKTGQTNKLMTKKPPIRFVDDDQLSGAKLVDYEFASDTNSITPHRNVIVMLTLKGSRGDEFLREATYQVAVGDKSSGLRSDN